MLFRSNEFVIRIAQKFDPKNESIKSLPKDFVKNYVVEPIFSYGFPQDRMNDLQQAQLEILMNIGSRREIMERLGKSNVTELMDEIMKDIEDIGNAQIAPQIAFQQSLGQEAPTT